MERVFRTLEETINKSAITLFRNFVNKYPDVTKWLEQVKDIIDKARENGQYKLFEHIPKEIDVHGLRREYAQSLYNALKTDRCLRDDN